MKNNRICSLLIVLSFPTIFTYAQEYKFGFIAGLDAANSYLGNKPEVAKGTRYFFPMVAFNVNAYIGYKGKGPRGFSLEPGFIQKGGVSINGVQRVRNELNYIQMPVLFDLYLKRKLFLQFGPEFAYLIKAKLRDFDTVKDITPSIQKLEISLTATLNYRVTKKIDLGFRYGHGITKTNQFPFANNTVANQYNQYLQVLFRFKV